ncbi:GNAT family N-acetyltransferase [Paenibacillus spongiae]|uniref:GNAT family N-acetyltransferase n=1 Tax=Paenibacillus spongiae TaxID=2909671 RepID=A0ABY5S6P1_9BACL|nr:GNAT family N-acetyltransferase [Paenibacillus spongiae]UVI27988.1 GNAT family N-acetyltransferase [Paenibacillus spongiae]
MYKEIEEAALNAWPALRTILRDGWLLRVSDGYTKRSNSVSPIYEACRCIEVEGRIRDAERFYANAGLNAVFKLTPFVHPPSLDELLSQSGYKLVDPSCVKLLTLDEEPYAAYSNGNVRIEESFTEGWLANAAALLGLSPSQTSVTRELLGSSPLTQGFAAVYVDGNPVACGIGVVEGKYMGLFDIVTAPEYRNQGYGQQLIRQLLDWGKSRGASACYLLVVENNKPAVRLYDKLGFETIYRYWYRVKPLAQI